VSDLEWAPKVILTVEPYLKMVQANDVVTIKTLLTLSDLGRFAVIIKNEHTVIVSRRSSSGG